MKYLLTIISFLACFCVKAQTANIKSVEQKDQKIYITYDLQGSPGKYEIKLFVKSNSSESWSSALKSVTGNVGINQSVDTNKQIIWDVLQDRNYFQGDWIFGIEAVLQDLKDFAIKDTSKVIKFKISDTEDNSIVISRSVNSNKWIIEGSKYTAKKSSVDLIMEIFYTIRVKRDVPKSANNTVINRLSVRHKKVEVFFENEKPFKTWFIGSPTQDHMGTYMLLQNGNKKSSISYITYKPGMYGSLDVRFFTDWEGWRK